MYYIIVLINVHKYFSSGKIINEKFLITKIFRSTVFQLYLYVESMALLALLSLSLLVLTRLPMLAVPVCVKAESILGAFRSSTAERRLVKHRVSVAP